MPRQNTAPSDYPQAVLRQIEALAQNIVIARKRRGESQAQWAKKLGISQPTMVRIERGDPSVAMASYVMCIWLINPAAGLADLIAPVHDHAALEQEVARVRAKRKPSDKVKRSRDPASGFSPETSAPAEVRKILGDLKPSESDSSATTIFEAQNLKMIEELKRAVLGMNNPSHLTSQAQGIAALLSKSGLKKND